MSEGLWLMQVFKFMASLPRSQDVSDGELSTSSAQTEGWTVPGKKLGMLLPQMVPAMRSLLSPDEFKGADSAKPHAASGQGS